MTSKYDKMPLDDRSQEQSGEVCGAGVAKKGAADNATRNQPKEPSQDEY